MSTFLTEGDIIKILPGEKVYAEVPEHFVYSNQEGNWETTHSDIHVQGVFDFYVGKYVVYKTSMEGGGTGHGPGDVYPDGHHVFCEKIGSPLVKVDFYQSGAFTVMHPDKKSIGRAKANWVVED